MINGLLIGLLIFAFIYGIGVGARQWFPYHLLKKAKNAFIEAHQNETQYGVAYDKNIIFESLRDDTEYYVLLLAGQSNMGGLGDINSLDKNDQQLPENIKFFNFSLDYNLNYKIQTFGPEVSLSQQLHSYFPNKHFVIIKYAVDGSSLLDWSPNWTYKKAQITGKAHLGPLYNIFIERIIQITGGKKINFLAMLWMQGETDAQIPKASKQYYKNLSIIISNLRTDLNEPNLPVFLGHVNPPLSGFPAVGIVRKAQEKISQNVRNVYLISTNNLQKWKNDDLHYNTQGQLELGKRFFLSLIKTITAQQNEALDGDSPPLHPRQ